MSERTIVEQEVHCAYCGKTNKIKVTRTTLQKATPGEYEVNVSAEQSNQSKLDEE